MDKISFTEADLLVCIKVQFLPKQLPSCDAVCFDAVNCHQCKYETIMSRRTFDASLILPSTTL